LYEGGLIDSETSIEFDRRVRDFKPTWDCLVPGFHTWFVASLLAKLRCQNFVST